MPAEPPSLPDSAAITEALTFGWTDADGSFWTTEPALQAPSAVVLRYVGGIVRDGARVGVFRRVVRPKDEGIEIEHVRLELEDEAKGHGFANAFWAASLDQYRSLGVSRITFTADSDGRLFWAREPVGFTDAGTPRELLGAWRSSDQESEPGQQAFRQAASNIGLPAEQVESFIADVTAHPDHYTPAGLHSSALGRLLLSTTAGGWGATVVLD